MNQQTEEEKTLNESSTEVSQDYHENVEEPFTANKEALRVICKNEKAYDICFEVLHELVVCDKNGTYLLSPRKNAPLFACIDCISSRHKILLKRNFSNKDLLKSFSRFLKIPTPGRLSGDSNSFQEYKKEAQAFINFKLKG